MEVVEVDSGLVRVSWQTKISKLNYKHREETTKINRRHPRATYDLECDLFSDPIRDKENTYEITLKISCSHRYGKSKHDYESEESSSDESSNYESSSSGEEESDQSSAIVSPFRPKAISIKIGKTKLNLKKKKDTKWKLSRHVITVPASPNIQNRIPLNCTILIKFESVSRGEKNAMQNFAEMFAQQTNCDVQFCFDGGEQIGAHKNILAARSPVFSAMFQHDMQEAKTGQVNIQDTQPENFKQLLHYIYAGRLSKPLEETTSQSLYFVAEKYDIGDLKKECIRFLVSSIRVDNAIELLLFAHLQSVDVVKNRVLNLMKCGGMGRKVVKRDEWEELAVKFPALCVEVTRHMME